jgi:hypothetical protein
MKKVSFWNLFISVFSVAIVLGTVPSALGAYNGIDPTIPQSRAFFQWCSSISQLDCVESFSVKHSDGKIESPKDYPNFTFHKGSLLGPLINLNFEISISTPAQWDIQKILGVDFPVLQIYAGEGVAELDPDDTFTLAIRTSWLNPLDVSGFARNSRVSESQIRGGRKWIISGQQAVAGVFNTEHDNWYDDLGVPDRPNHAADIDQPVMYWRIDHINPAVNGSPFETTCSEKGYTITSSNASQAGMPYMIGRDTLSYNVYAPHFKSDGKTLNMGFFQATVPLAWLDCRWPGNTLSKAAKVEISITDDSGARQVVTSSAAIKEGKLQIAVSGFHYSAPIIKVRGVNTAKSSTITCRKGKTVKKISGVNPKCPSGYTSK